MQNQNMNLVLSTDAKPRLKWTSELHQRFVEAVNQLGGADKATPKGLMRVMGIHGLTMYHLKSHLQKYRLGKSQPVETSSDSKQQVYKEIQTSDGNFQRDVSHGTQNQIHESLHIAQALQLQLEVQRKLHEQIEVQRHLQLRIEAQGKYLQTVLKKAQETLAGYGSSPASAELAKAELSQLVSMVNCGCQSSSISVLTETRELSVNDFERKQIRNTICSMESSLTSSEGSGRKEEEKQLMNGPVEQQRLHRASVELPLMEIHGSGNQANERKRSRSTISDGNCVELFSGSRSTPQKDKSNSKLRKFEFAGMIDLNSRYHQNDSDSAPKAIDLNSNGIEQLSGHFQQGW